MPRSTSIPSRLHRRAPPPPPNRLYHCDYTPAVTSAQTPDHLTVESGDGTFFCIPSYLLAHSSFIADLYSLPGGREVVILHGISASVLAFALACARDSRRRRRHSAPAPASGNHGRSGKIGETIEGRVPGASGTLGFTKDWVAIAGRPLLPSNAWSWAFMTQVLTLAFAYDLPHALEHLAQDSGDFYDPVLCYSLWALVGAAKDETDSQSYSHSHSPGTKQQAPPGRVVFPGSPSNPPNTTLTAWAPALLRADWTISQWCIHALDTHLPAALDSLEELLNRRQEIVSELAAAEQRITSGVSIRLKEPGLEKDKRHSWDIFTRRTSVATLFLRVDRLDAVVADTKPSRGISRRTSLRGKQTQPPKCTRACKVVLKRKLTAAVGLATRVSFTEKFGTLRYFVEYTYEGIECAACRQKVTEALVWVWCMKVPWRGGLGV